MARPQTATARAGTVPRGPRGAPHRSHGLPRKANVPSALGRHLTARGRRSSLLFLPVPVRDDWHTRVLPPSGATGALAAPRARTARPHLHAPRDSPGSLQRPPGTGSQEDSAAPSGSPPPLASPPVVSKTQTNLISSHRRGPRALGRGVRVTVPCQCTTSQHAPPKTRQAVSIPQVTLGAKASESKSTQPPAGPADIWPKRKRSTSHGSVCTVTAVAATDARVQGTRPHQTVPSRVRSLPHANTTSKSREHSDRP